MSDRIEEYLREQYPGINFNAYVSVIKLTQEEVDELTGKKKQEQENKFIAPNEVIPNKVIEQEVQDEGNMENYTTQEKENTSIEPNEVIPNKVIEQEVQDEGNMENYTTQEKENTSIAPNEVIPNKVIEQEVQDEGNMENYTASNNYNPYMIIKQEIQNDCNTESYVEETQEMENLPNLSNEFIPDVVIKQEIQDDDYYNNYNTQQDDENMFDPSNNFIPNIMFDPEMQNDNMDINTEQENMFDSSNNFIPNMINGPEFHNNTNLENYMPQVNVNMPNPSIGFVPIRIKQEFNNPNTEFFTSQEGMFDPSNNFIPNVSGQDTQNDSNMEMNLSQRYENKFTPSSGSVPNNIVIKQEILDDGNIEIFTDVLMPSADQGYEDGTP